MIKIVKRDQPSKAIFFFTPVLAIFLTLIAGGIIFYILGFKPFEALKFFFIVPIADKYGFSELLLKATPLCLIAIGLSFCFNPTWGLDVGAINYIHETLIKINEQNKSIILISTDTDELLKLSDKISVIHKGKLSKIMNAEEVTSEKLGILMGGGN